MSDQSSYEAAKYAHDLKLRAAERAHDQAANAAEQYREATVRAGQEAMKVALLINGGAAVAVLAFVGGLATRTGISLGELKAVTHSLYWFAGGVVSAAITAGCGFFASDLYAGSMHHQDRSWEHPYLSHNEKSKMLYNLGWWCSLGGTVLAGISLVLFVVGIWVASTTIANFSVR
jgi:hypothetical protein